MGHGTKGAAKTDVMASLHDELAKQLIELVRDGETVHGTDDEGKPTEKKVRASAAVLNVVRSFLRDNDITTDPDHPSRPVGDLANAMKDFEKTDDEDLPKFTN